MSKIKDNSARAKQAMIVLWILIGLDIITILSDYSDYLSIGDNLNKIDNISKNSGKTIIGVSSSINFSIFISAFFFIRWFRRAYNNLHLVQVSNITFSELWASFSWFIPFINLLRPYKIMKEIWTLTQKNIIGNKTIIETSLISWWWFFWITSTLLGGFVSFSRKNSAAIIRDIETLTLLNIFANVLHIVCGFLVIKLIFEISGFESKFKKSHDDAKLEKVA